MLPQVAIDEIAAGGGGLPTIVGGAIVLAETSPGGRNTLRKLTVDEACEIIRARHPRRTFKGPNSMNLVRAAGNTYVCYC